MTDWEARIQEFKSTGKSRDRKSAQTRATVIMSMRNMVDAGNAPAELIKLATHPVNKHVYANTVVAKALGLSTINVAKYVCRFQMKSPKPVERSKRKTPAKRFSGYQAVTLVPYSPICKTEEELQKHLMTNPKVVGKNISVVFRHRDLEIQAPKNNEIRELSSEEFDFNCRRSEFHKLVTGNTPITRAGEIVGIGKTEAYRWARELGIKSAQQERRKESVK